jgi:hypothetical protein
LTLTVQPLSTLRTATPTCPPNSRTSVWITASSAGEGAAGRSARRAGASKPGISMVGPDGPACAVLRGAGAAGRGGNGAGTRVMLADGVARSAPDPADAVGVASIASGPAIRSTKRLAREKIMLPNPMLTVTVAARVMARNRPVCVAYVMIMDQAH